MGGVACSTGKWLQVLGMSLLEWEVAPWKTARRFAGGLGGIRVGKVCLMRSNISLYGGESSG